MRRGTLELSVRAVGIYLGTAAVSLLAVLGCGDSNFPMAAAPEALESVLTAAAALTFGQVDAGLWHSCGVTTDSRAYCWGENSSGAIGDGTKFLPRDTPTAVAGGLRFQQISAGAYYSCGVTTDYLAYCWGSNGRGQLGDGTLFGPGRPVPVAVAGGLRFRQVATGSEHTCGVTYPDNRAYCWGLNSDGQLGDGTQTSHSAPVPVSGGLFFKQVSAGETHSCGITMTVNRAYCWGWNRWGQLGDSTTVARRLRPTRVAAGTRRFRQISAGILHTCAVTTTHRAFCWGNGRLGQIGDGKTHLSFWPRAVVGGLYFDRVTSGSLHTCGETTTDKAYCWGDNTHGKLGDGTVTQRLTPVAVAGGLSVAQMSAGGIHTCAKTGAGVGYCWGNNWYGQVGDGTAGIHRLTPTPIAGAL